MLGRRGPAQAAFTNPEVRELGEMHRRRHRHRPGRGRARRGQPRLRRVRGLRPDPPPQRRDLHRVRPARARGQAEADRAALLPLAGRDQGRRQGRVDRRRPQRALRRRVRHDPRPRHRRARGDRVRAGAALDRLQGHRARGAAVRRAPRPDPERVRPGGRSRVRRAGPRPLRGRLDQARPVRRDRHEQEGRARHGEHPLRRPGRRPRPEPSALRRTPGGEAEDVAPIGSRTWRRSQELLAERGGDHVTYIGWQAIDARRGSRPASRTAARGSSSVASHEMVEAARRAWHPDGG